MGSLSGPKGNPILYNWINICSAYQPLGRGGQKRSAQSLNSTDVAYSGTSLEWATHVFCCPRQMLEIARAKSSVPNRSPAPFPAPLPPLRASLMEGILEWTEMSHRPKLDQE